MDRLFNVLPSNRTVFSRAGSIGCVGLLVFLSGCSEPEVVTYQVPKEDRETASSFDPRAVRSTDTIPDTSPTGGAAPREMPVAPFAGGGAASGGAQMGMAVLPGMERSAEGAGELGWGDLPATWQEFEPSGIRVANFRVQNQGGAAELTVLAFPGDVGGDLANVNRWREQVGLAPLRPAELETRTERIAVDGRDSLFVLMHGQRESVVGAFVPTETHTWFFKMQGSQAAISFEETPFRRFMETVTISK